MPGDTDSAERPTPYDDQLSRLAEILGSIHYLRNLCNTGKEDSGEPICSNFSTRRPKTSRNAKKD